MTTILLTAVILFCGCDAPPDRTFEEIVISADGRYMVHLSNTWVHLHGHNLIITVNEDPQTVVHEYNPHAAGSRESGPYIWGCVDGSMYTCGYIANVFGGGYDMVRIMGGPRPIADMIEMEEARHTGTREERNAIWNRMSEFSLRYLFECHPLNQYIIDRAGQAAGDRGEDTLSQTWNLSFDAIYRSLDEVTVAAAHEGDLLVWERDRTQDPGNTDWTTREPVETTIDSHFRILRAGEQLYLVDTEGAIYADVDEDHKQIGMVRGWEGESPVILLEDQHREKIGFLRISAAGEITVLGVDWTDQSFAEDFLTEVTSPELRAAIIRMAEIMREDAGSGE